MSKSGPRPSEFNTFDCRRASRPNSQHFFNISMSKSGSTPSLLNIFDLWMCFAPQQRTLFRYLNFQKWLEQVLSSTFSLRHVLCATAVCNFDFSSSQMAPHPPLWRAYFSTLWNQKTMEETRCFATFLPFRAPASSFWFFLFSDFFPLLLSSLTLPTSASASGHIVGSLTSKHTSISKMYSNI